MSRSRGYCYTLPNYTETDHDQLLKVDTSFTVIGKEICPTTGTPHLQCYFYFKNVKSFKVVQKLLGKGHIEAAKGTCLQNFDYCKKGGSYRVVGLLPQKGKRTDLENCIDIAIEKGSLAAAKQYRSTYARYYKGIEKCKELHLEEYARNWEMVNIVFHGISGSGKTTLAKELSCGSIYFKPDGEWWDGYHGQNIVVLDDFYGGLKFVFLLKLLDSNPLHVPFKGGFHVFRSRSIIFTSNLPPEKWYHFEDYEQKKESMMRRLNGGIWAINDSQSRVQTKANLIVRYPQLFDTTPVK